MIQLNNELYYNENLPFDEQADEVKEFIRNYYYDNAQFLPPEGMQPCGIFEFENGSTTYDNFMRPDEVSVKLGKLVITGKRIYQNQSYAWCLHNETITIKIDEQ